MLKIRADTLSALEALMSTVRASKMIVRMDAPAMEGVSKREGAIAIGVGMVKIVRNMLLVPTNT